MGNRAIITTFDKDIGVYLHWNGGMNSVTGFLTFCKLKGYRSPETDSYGWARLCQVIGTFFGGVNSVGIDLYRRLDKDNGDNGVYVIEKWEVMDRIFGEWDEVNMSHVKEFVEYINERYPDNDKLEQSAIDKYFEEV